MCKAYRKASDTGDRVHGARPDRVMVQEQEHGRWANDHARLPSAHGAQANGEPRRHECGGLWPQLCRDDAKREQVEGHEHGEFEPHGASKALVQILQAVRKSAREVDRAREILGEMRVDGRQKRDGEQVCTVGEWSVNEEVGGRLASCGGLWRRARGRADELAAAAARTRRAVA